MGTEPNEKTVARYVGIGVGNYKHYSELSKAITDVREIGEVLKQYYFEGRLIEDPDSEKIWPELNSKIEMNSFPSGGSLIVLWSGHGENSPEGKLRLVPTDGLPSGTPEPSSETLAGFAARTGASQILLILDTCYSGRGVTPSVDIAARVIRELPPNAQKVWFGVVASTMDFARARDGIFGSHLLRLLREGPVSAENCLRWSIHSAGVRGDDFIDALFDEWDDSYQKPKRAETGHPSILLPNPNYDPNAPEQLVEHLLMAAQGRAPDEEGSFFTGRTAQLDQIASWIRERKPGVFLVTGPAGSGKSALLGRIVSLSNPEERSKIAGRDSFEHADPGQKVVHAHVHARGITAEGLCGLIDAQLVRKGVLPKNLSGPRNRGELLGAMERRETRLLLVIDGLDESGSEASRIAKDVIRMLALECLVLVSTREIQVQEGGLSLTQTLGPVQTIDLGAEEIQEQTRRDIRAYVNKRLSQVSEKMDPEVIFTAIQHIHNEQQEGAFLLAQMITAQLRSNPVNTSRKDLERQLYRSIEAAFERELSRISLHDADERESSNTAKELLTALAWGYGAGLPDDLWPIVGTALSQTGVIYQRSDVFRLLTKAGRYIVESGEAGRAVYRLSHQRILEHLHPKPDTMKKRIMEEDTASRVAVTLVRYYKEFMEQGRLPKEHPYLLHNLWLHCVDSGERGIAFFRDLVHYYKPNFFLPDLAKALNSHGIRCRVAGKSREAGTSLAEAVGIYSDLAEINSAFLPDLAASLNHLGVLYGEAGKHQDALAATERAVRIHRELAEFNSAFLPDLADDLCNLGIYQSEILGEGLIEKSPGMEAVQIYKKLSRKSSAFMPDLIRAERSLILRYDQMVLVEAGPFLYGDPPEERSIEQPYYIDIYPVTNEQYRKFMDAGGYSNETFWSSAGFEWKEKNNITCPKFWNDEKWNKDGHPVVGVSYHEAEAYAKWAGKSLPTEMEWERAARGTDGRLYPWGNEFDLERCNTWESRSDQTSHVTRYPNGISPVGCYDMVGNVWEWTKTPYRDGSEYYALRGGAWYFDRLYARCAARSYLFHPYDRYNYVGFRCSGTNV